MPDIVNVTYEQTVFSDEEHLEYLFKLYEKMIQEDKDTLFAKANLPARQGKHEERERHDQEQQYTSLSK